MSEENWRHRNRTSGRRSHMEDLLLRIKDKEEDLWLLLLDLQKLKMGDSKFFRKQDFSRIRETCMQILGLIGEEV